MKMFYKRVLIALLSFLSACTPNASEWVTQEASFSYPCTAVSRLYLSTNNSYEGIEVEIFSDGCSRWVYLNLFSCPLKYTDERIFDIGKIGELVLEGIILKGGQKIMLTEDSAEAFIHAIECGAPVELSIGNYHASI